MGTDGLVTGCVVGDLNFAETANFGARAKEPAFAEQFVGIDAINGGAFQALSGATITSTAVKDATNAALRCVAVAGMGQEPKANPIVAFGEGKPAAPAEVTAGEDGSLRTRAEGFGGGDVIVNVTVGDDGSVSKLVIDASSQTEGYGTRVAEDAAFAEQFIGQAGPFAIGENIDALSGATITSKAVVEAVNNALGFTSDAPAEEKAPVTTEEDGSLRTTAKGFGDAVVIVKVTVGDDGSVSKLYIDASTQTEYIGTRVMEEPEFAEQFIGQSGPFAIGENIDALSGATITSKAVVEAVNNALGFTSDAPAEEKAPVTTEEDGSLRTTAKGFGDAVVIVKVTVGDDGSVSKLYIDASTQTEYIGTRVMEEPEFAEQFIGQSGPFAIGENIDALSGATITSKAVVEAVNNALGFTSDAPAEEKAPVTTEEDGSLRTTAKGFGDAVVIVKVTVGDDGSVSKLYIDASTQTEYIGTRVMEEPEFGEQFIGQSGPFTIGENIDALSGATISSKAVVEAVNNALGY